MQLPSSFSSSSLYNDFTYDVFISFRGTDTRFGFTGYLYKALSENGIHTFIDDKELPTGDEITPSLRKSIEDSRIAIIVLSKNYADSSFCLDELVHIIHCSREKGTTVIPVFYGTEPSHVRKLNDSYGEALAKHEEGFQNNMENMERLLKWKEALHQAANLSGHHFTHGNKYEHKFIEEIVKDVSYKIFRFHLHVADNLVGLESRISEVNSLLDLGSNDGVCIIGILGAGGLGKTTLAEAVYNSIVNQFECRCFLYNVRENSFKHSLKYLQEQLLSKTISYDTPLEHVNEGIEIIKQRLGPKKVLLILDDVDEIKQLQVLIGEPGWLGCGSKVIITTRDKQLLSCHGITKIYEADRLNKEESLELLRKLTFKSNINDSSYDHILNRAVEYASGLPLALRLVGSKLFGKGIKDCESTLDKYETIQLENIQKILQVSYDALEENQQSVFLDIACVFKGCGVKYVQEALHGHYGYCIKHHLGVLVDESLVKICAPDPYNTSYIVTLHDLIEDMGIEIARQESIREPGERSRLWRRDDIVHVLVENKGTSKIEMIYLNCSSMEPIDMNGKAFKKMTELKTLIIENGHFSKGLKYLPSSLRVLKWKGFTSESLSSCFSNKKNFNNMKILTLDCSDYLTHIPDVSGLPNLEKLSFQNCKKLTTIHNSVGYLYKLEILDATMCKNLKSFPPLQLPSLKKLELHFCRSLKSFPELLCKMSNIKEIWLCDTSIEELPFSFKNLSELHKLVIMEKNFKILPKCLGECHYLQHLYLDYCYYLEEIRGIPPNLKNLYAEGCKSLSSSSKRMLLSQKLHDAGCNNIVLPTGTERIPNWFEHQVRGHNTISFWLCKKIPSITCIILIPEFAAIKKFNLFVNGNECIGSGYLFDYNGTVLPSDHAFLFDMNLDDYFDESFGNKPELYEAFKNNEWNHVELNWITEKNDHVSAQMGIHVSWEGDDCSDTEGDVIFTDPYIIKRRYNERRRKKY